jgi:hypothetical protein
MGEPSPGRVRGLLTVLCREYRRRACYCLKQLLARLKVPRAGGDIEPLLDNAVALDKCGTCLPDACLHVMVQKASEFGSRKPFVFTVGRHFFQTVRNLQVVDHQGSLQCPALDSMGPRIIIRVTACHWRMHRFEGLGKNNLTSVPSACHPQPCWGLHKVAIVPH